MKRPLMIDPRQMALVACFLVFIGLVAVDGWSWPLQAAAFLFPVAAVLLG
jgi:hypothetical protein